MIVVASNFYVIIVLAAPFNCSNQAPSNGHCNIVSTDCRSVTSTNLLKTQKETVFVFLVSGAVVINVCCISCRKYDMIYQIYWIESMLYNFRTSNYVQQRKTYTTTAAKVHLNCYSAITVT
jgi:hypothetical protein